MRRMPASRPPAGPAADCPRSWLGERHDEHARRTLWVVILTAVMMVAEIVGGTIYGSMAVVADGWHMATHAAALGVATLAYRYATRHATNPRFTFGTGKVGELAGFASAVSLAIVAAIIAWQSAQRLIHPQPIAFTQAGGIAVVGLLVNLASAWLLRHDHAHDQDHDHDHEEHDHDHAEHGHDHGQHSDANLRAAYMHVMADALTSVLAIAGLLAGRFFGWIWMDAVIGILGAIVITHWSIGLARNAARSLLDSHDDQPLEDAVRERLLSADPNLQVRDLHLWRIGPGHYSLVVSLHAAQPLTPGQYKARLADLKSISHVIVEVDRA
jgi:cation diffusion facilitator family transporter